MRVIVGRPIRSFTFAVQFALQYMGRGCVVRAKPSQGRRSVDREPCEGGRRSCKRAQQETTPTILMMIDRLGSMRQQIEAGCMGNRRDKP